MQRTGRARVDPLNPISFFRCDRCGFWDNRDRGVFQKEWRGQRLVNIQLFVCQRCLDKPFLFNRPIVYPPDPKPVFPVRIEPFTLDNAGSPFTPPLPWPSQEEGPAVASPPTPAPPVYVTPPLPPLPPDIEGDP